MKYGWRLVLTPLWALCIAGAFVTAFLAMGWYSWAAFSLAGLVGLAIGVPVGIWNTKKVRRDDPWWQTGSKNS